MKKYFTKKQINIYLLLIFILTFLFYAYSPALALKSLSEEVPCMKTGDCGISDFVLLAIGVSKMILGVSGAVTLLFFVYGGFMMLISGGSQERVTKGKQIITGSIIGLVIIFTSYSIIFFTLKAMGLDNTQAESKFIVK